MEQISEKCNIPHPRYRGVTCRRDLHADSLPHVGQLPRRGYWIEWTLGEAGTNRHGFPVFGRLKSNRIKSPQVGAKRARLFNANRHCFWCGVATIWRREFPLTPDTATVDHLYSRLHPERGLQHTMGRYEDRYVLACWGCNRRRNQDEINGKLFVPKIPERQQIALVTSAVARRLGLAQPSDWRDVVARHSGKPCQFDLALYNHLITNAPDWTTTRFWMQQRHAFINQTPQS